MCFHQSGFRCVHECHSQCVCTRAIFGVFARVTIWLCLHPSGFRSLHGWHFRSICTRVIFGAFGPVRHLVCFHQFGFRCVCTSVIHGVFARVPFSVFARVASGEFARVSFSVCLHPSGIRLFERVLFPCVLNARQFQCVRTNVVFGVFTHTFLVCVFAPGFVFSILPSYCACLAPGKR